MEVVGSIPTSATKNKTHKMKVAQLVTSTNRQFAGIGCVSKVLKKSVRVNHGTDSVMTCNPQNLSLVNTENCKTLKFSDFKRMSVVNSKDLPSCVIIGNEVNEYVGIGWISRGVVEPEDLKKYPLIVE